MSHFKPAVCVIIPFYQLTPEPLIRAIHSILAQQGVDKPLVLIVDDGSPVSAQKIIDEHFPAHKEFIRVIVQKNSGAAKARNTGLDNVPDTTRYIAFLDSDDEWTPHHLSNALRMFEMGCDFYFADHKRSEWHEGKFNLASFSPDQHKCLDESASLYKYTGDILFPIMNDHLIQTSTVVFRRSAMQDIRFPVALVLGEDEIFWVKAMRCAGKIGFCRNIEVLMGKGVNISQGGDWGNERSFQLITQNLRYWQSIPDLLPADAQLETLRKLKIDQLRHNLAASVWHRLMRGKSLPIKPIADFTRADPAWLFSLWNVLFNRITRKQHD